jgi:hypothetical protein
MSRFELTCSKERNTEPPLMKALAVLWIMDYLFWSLSADTYLLEVFEHVVVFGNPSEGALIVCW